MTLFNEIWNSVWRNSPSDSDNASEGASNMRDIKNAIEERIAVDHIMGSSETDATNKDGQHTAIHMVTQTGSPSAEADGGMLYVKDVSGSEELFYSPAPGASFQLTQSGAIQTPFSIGDRILFSAATAPNGWTQVTTFDDKMIRVVNTAGGGIGGDWEITGLTVDDTTLDMTQIPEHSFTFPMRIDGNSSPSTGNPEKGTGGAAEDGVTDSLGGGLGHDHPLSADGTWRPEYHDMILCEWDGTGGGSGGAILNPGAYDIMSFFPGVPTADELIFGYTLPREITLPVDFNGAVAKCRVVPTADTVFSIQQNAVEIATVTFLLGLKDGVFNVIASTETVLAAGDDYDIVAPNPVDATCADINITVSGTRT